MTKTILFLSACLSVAGCSTTPAPPMAPPKPEKIGPAPSQPGNCFYRGPDGKVFISAC
ncbi:MAG: hypothetical protein J0I23_02615 [Rhizobiales bacterium]|nr:hypothetical protein [Hyphomicrobiales bacterium]